MNRFSKILSGIIITIICLTGLVIVGSSESSVSGEGNGDNWGVDIFTDNWSTQNVTTKKIVKNTTATKNSIEGKEKVVIQRTNVKKIVIKNRKAKISLKALKGVTGYYVKFSTSSKFSKAKTKTVDVKKAKFTIKNIRKAKKYYIKARAYRRIGNKIYYGKWSKAKRKKLS